MVYMDYDMAPYLVCVFYGNLWLESHSSKIFKLK